ncbi:MAG: transglutaminase family protein [Rhodocyclaceae bacterium]
MSPFRLKRSLAASVWVLACLAIAYLLLPAHAVAKPTIAALHLQTLRELAALPDSQIDLLRIKLTIDRMIDPAIDIDAEVARVEAMAVELAGQVPLLASSRVKLDVLRRYVYQPGPWNQHRSFSYDLGDPFGRVLRNKLLPTYLNSRKGNCVSMPILFLALGERIGLDLSLATAPEHIFIKFRDDDGTLYNLETTSGAGVTRDLWMRKQLPMTDAAINNGIYMRPLTKREAIGVLADVLLSHYGRQKQTDARIALATLMLEIDPRDVRAMLALRAAYRYMWATEFVEKYPTPNDIPIPERPRFVELERSLLAWQRKAEALGWRMPPETYQ